MDFDVPDLVAGSKIFSFRLERLFEPIFIEANQSEKVYFVLQSDVYFGEILNENKFSNTVMIALNRGGRYHFLELPIEVSQEQIDNSTECNEHVGCEAQRILEKVAVETEKIEENCSEIRKMIEELREQGVDLELPPLCGGGE